MGQTKLKKIKLLSFILILMLVLGACNQEDAKETDKKEDSKDLKKVSVMLDWYPNAIHSYLYVAKEKGYFEDEGVDVDFQFPANPTDPLTLAASGKITVGMYYQPDVIMAKAQENIPIKSIAAVTLEPLNHIVYRSDDPIKSPKDLAGKKVGYPGIPLNEALVKTVVEHDGGNYDDVEMINVEFELGSSLISKQVSAASGMFVNHEVPVLRSEGHDVDFINPVDYGVPSYYEVVAVTSEDTWEKEQASVEAFWRAARKGFDFMEENPEDALQILLDNQDDANFPLDKAVETQSMDILIPKMTNEKGFGHQEKASWEETAKWLKEYDLIDDIPNLDDIFVNID